VAARWSNVVLAPLFVVSIVASVIGESWVYFWFLSAAEVVVLAGIAWLAWSWPRVIFSAPSSTT
jgi:hypothetical protein